MLFGKQIIIPEATLKINYNSIKPKQLNVFDINKTISKRTHSQFLCHTCLEGVALKIQQV